MSRTENLNQAIDLSVSRNNNTHQPAFYMQNQRVFGVNPCPICKSQIWNHPSASTKGEDTIQSTMVDWMQIIWRILS